MLSLMTVSVLCLLLLLMQCVEVECGGSSAFKRLSHSSTETKPPIHVLQESVLLSGMDQEGVDQSTGLRETFLCYNQYGMAGTPSSGISSSSDIATLNYYVYCIVVVVKGWYNNGAGMSALQQTYNCTDGSMFYIITGSVYGNSNSGYNQPVLTVSTSVTGNCITTISYWNNPDDVGAIVFQPFFWTTSTPLMGTTYGSENVTTPPSLECLSWMLYTQDANGNTVGLTFYWTSPDLWLTPGLPSS